MNSFKKVAKEVLLSLFFGYTTLLIFIGAALLISSQSKVQPSNGAVSFVTLMEIIPGVIFISTFAILAGLAKHFRLNREKYRNATWREFRFLQISTLLSFVLLGGLIVYYYQNHTGDINLLGYLFAFTIYGAFVIVVQTRKYCWACPKCQSFDHGFFKEPFRKSCKQCGLEKYQTKS